MIKSFFGSKGKIILAWGGLFILVYLLQVQVHYSVMVNEWYKPFYNMMQTASKHTVSEYWEQFVLFAKIVFPYCLVSSLTSYVTRVYGFEWRQAITFNYIPRWRNVKERIEGESQRIQEDAQKFAAIVESLGLQVVSAIMTLIAFMPVLWTLSEQVDITPVSDLVKKGFSFFPDCVIAFYSSLEANALVRNFFILFLVILFVAGTKYIKEYSATEKTNRTTVVFLAMIFALPFSFLLFVAILPPVSQIQGILVWVALSTSLGGMVISWFVGIRLPGLEYLNQVVEAKFRKELVLAEDDKEHYGTIPTVTELFTGIRHNYFRLFNNYTYFNMWATLYRQFMIIVPYLIIGPGLFTGAVTLGVLTQASGAFGEVNGSCSVMIDNWTRITELRSIWRRLHEFEAAMDKYTS